MDFWCVLDYGAGECRGQTANKRFPMQSVRNLIMDILYFNVAQTRNLVFKFLVFLARGIISRTHVKVKDS